MNEMIIEAVEVTVDPLTGDRHGLKATVDGAVLFVSEDPANRHYAAILKAVEAGELVIEPAQS